MKKIILHCSDSEFGDSKTIDGWHREKGWNGIGYHYVILNGNRKSRSDYKKEDDGVVEVGRDIDIMGAHCRGHNMDSIGVCLIGKNRFTANQLLNTLPAFLSHLCIIHKISRDNVFGHYEFSDTKTCPNIDMTLVRKYYFLPFPVLGVQPGTDLCLHPPFKK